MRNHYQHNCIMFQNLLKYHFEFHCRLHYCRNVFFFFTNFNLNLVHWFPFLTEKTTWWRNQLIKMLFNSSGNQSDKQHETPR